MDLILYVELHKCHVVYMGVYLSVHRVIKALVCCSVVVVVSLFVFVVLVGDMHCSVVLMTAAAVATTGTVVDLLGIDKCWYTVNGIEIPTRTTNMIRYNCSGLSQLIRKLPPIPNMMLVTIICNKERLNESISITLFAPDIWFHENCNQFDLTVSILKRKKKEKIVGKILKRA